MGYSCQDCGKVLATAGGLDVHRAQWCAARPPEPAATGAPNRRQSRRQQQRAKEEQDRKQQARAEGKRQRRETERVAQEAEARRRAEEEELRRHEQLRRQQALEEREARRRDEMRQQLLRQQREEELRRQHEELVRRELPPEERLPREAPREERTDPDGDPGQWPWRVVPGEGEGDGDGGRVPPAARAHRAPGVASGAGATDPPAVDSWPRPPVDAEAEPAARSAWSPSSGQGDAADVDEPTGVWTVPAGEDESEEGAEGGWPAGAVAEPAPDVTAALGGPPLGAEPAADVAAPHGGAREPVETEVVQAVEPVQAEARAGLLPDPVAAVDPPDDEAGAQVEGAPAGVAVEPVQADVGAAPLPDHVVAVGPSDAEAGAQVDGAAAGVAVEPVESEPGARLLPDPVAAVGPSDAEAADEVEGTPGGVAVEPGDGEAGAEVEGAGFPVAGDHAGPGPVPAALEVDAPEEPGDTVGALLPPAPDEPVTVDATAAANGGWGGDDRVGDDAWLHQRAPDEELEPVNAGGGGEATPGVRLRAIRAVLRPRAPWQCRVGHPGPRYCEWYTCLGCNDVTRDTADRPCVVCGSHDKREVLWYWLGFAPGEDGLLGAWYCIPHDTRNCSRCVGRPRNRGW